MCCFDLFGCPLHLGVSNVGIMPSIDVLNENYSDININKIEEIILAEDNLPNLKNLNSVVATCNAIADCSSNIIKQGKTPLFIGGDHACAIGTISASCRHHKSLGLLWVDSHSDINTDKTTVTGNIHGMPVSAVLGLGEQQLVDVHFRGVKMLPQNVVLFGVRDIDPPEYDIIKQLGIKCYSYDDIISRGLDVCLSEVFSYLCNIDGLHLSFDLDSMNPNLIKGVSVPVDSGFNVDDVYTIIDFVLNKFKLAAVDIVEFNPVADVDGFTEEFTHKLIRKIMDFYI